MIISSGAVIGCVAVVVVGASVAADTAATGCFGVRDGSIAVGINGRLGIKDGIENGIGIGMGADTTDWGITVAGGNVVVDGGSVVGMTLLGAVVVVVLGGRVVVDGRNVVDGGAVVVGASVVDTTVVSGVMVVEGGSVVGADVGTSEGITDVGVGVGIDMDGGGEGLIDGYMYG